MMKNIYKIDLVLIIGSLLVLLVLIGYVRPLVIAPIDGYETTNTGILFSIEKAERLLIDDNFEFSTPDEYYLKDDLKIDLSPGKYYWKTIGLATSEVRTLTIKSEVNLELREVKGDGYDVINIGNVVLNIDVYNGTNLIERKKLGIGESTKSNGTKLVGGLDDGE